MDVFLEGRIVELSLSKPAEIISERTRSIVYPLPQLWFACPDNLWHVPAEGHEKHLVGHCQQISVI